MHQGEGGLAVLRVLVDGRGLPDVSPVGRPPQEDARAAGPAGEPGVGDVQGAVGPLGGRDLVEELSLLQVVAEVHQGAELVLPVVEEVARVAVPVPGEEDPALGALPRDLVAGEPDVGDADAAVLHADGERVAVALQVELLAGVGEAGRGAVVGTTRHHEAVQGGPAVVADAAADAGFGAGDDPPRLGLGGRPAGDPGQERLDAVPGRRHQGGLPGRDQRVVEVERGPVVVAEDHHVVRVDRGDPDRRLVAALAEEVAPQVVVRQPAGRCSGRSG